MVLYGCGRAAMTVLDASEHGAMTVECEHESKAEANDAGDALRSGAEPHSHRSESSHAKTGKATKEGCHNRLDDKPTKEVEDKASAGELMPPASRA